MDRMAFYTSRVDDNGNELERRHSTRSTATTRSNNSVRMDLSSRSYNGKGSVMFVNPAAFIEKTPRVSEASSINDVNEEKLTGWEDQNDGVPPLDLQSEENYPTPCDQTFSYHKSCEAAKIIMKPDVAYATWLTSKSKLMSQEAARRRKAEEQMREEQEARKRLSEEKVKIWLEQKTKQQNRFHEKLKSGGEAEEKPSKTKISEEDARSKIVEWERTKRLEEERRRVIQRQKKENRIVLEETRRQQAAKAWQEWSAEAANKPKPVPLNRGFDTLRGTISNIYVNPNEWKAQTEESLKAED